MTATNDITGDRIKSAPANEKYREGWERIFGKNRKEGDSVLVPETDC